MANDPAAEKPDQNAPGPTEEREDDNTVTAPDPSEVPDPESGPPPEGYGGGPPT